MRPLIALALALALLGALTACADDSDTPAPTADAGSDDTSDASDTGTPSDASAPNDAAQVDTTETPCGPSLTCTSGEVCVAVCLCCGVDTGNPADQRSDYRCVAPDPACAGRPSECIDNEAFTPNITGDTCQPTGDYTCALPCA